MNDISATGGSGDLSFFKRHLRCKATQDFNILLSSGLPGSFCPDYHAPVVLLTSRLPLRDQTNFQVNMLPPLYEAYLSLDSLDYP